MARPSVLRRLAVPLSVAFQQQRTVGETTVHAAVVAGRALATLAGCTATPDPPLLHCTGCGCGRCAPSPWRAVASAVLTRQLAAGSRAYRCCPGLDGAPPDRVVIEYDPDDVDTYIQVADAIEEAFPNVVVDGNVDAEGRPGSFEVVGAAGRVLFSRLASGGVRPQAAAIVAALAADGAGMAGECSIGTDAPQA